MNRKIPRLFGSLAIAISLSVGMLVSTAVAATPNIAVGSGSFGHENGGPPFVSGAVPSAVSAGNVAGFYVWARNNDTSTISQFFLDSVSQGAAVGATWIRVSGGVTSSGPNSCPVTGGHLACTFGALRPGETIYVTAGFTAVQTPASDPDKTCLQSTGIGVSPTSPTYMCVDFQWTTTGIPPDKKHRSHGDAFEWFDAVKIEPNNNFGGQFPFCDQTQTDCTTVSAGHLSAATTGSLSTGNAQLTILTGPPSAQNSPYTTSALEAADGGFFPDPTCTTAKCVADRKTFFGEWSFVVVNDGQDFSGGTPIHIVLMLYKPNITPNQVHGVYHSWNDASGSGEENVDTVCDTSTPPGNAPCYVATKVGKDLQIDVWVFHNGNVHGY